jgi:hypothetical protein
MGKIEEENLKSLNQDYELTVLVDNKPITEYFHDGKVFIEGRHGSDYKIRIRNNTYRRAVFIVSVDGLSVLNGKDCSDDSPGYVLGSHETLDIACYKVDDATGAKFIFGTKEKSYSAEIGKGTDNVGVIAVKVFAEKPAYSYYHHHCFPPPQYGAGYSVLRSAGAAGSLSAKSSSARSKIIGSAGSPVPSGGWGNINLGEVAQNTITSNSTGPMESFSAQTMCDTSGVVAGHTGMPIPEAAQDEAGLGTVFGDAMAWKTQTVSFDRERYPACQLTVFYDTRKNLERRGIKFEQKVPPLPNPFPGNNGCTTPPGWRK